jgi:hypothetical protein
MKFMIPPEQRDSPEAWRRYAFAFIAIVVGFLVAAYTFVLLVDPFGISPVSLPLKRALVTVQRYMYPQLIRSHRFDSALFGTSTSMLLDPEILNGPFEARFANLSMASATAWEQKTLIELFLREVRHPKVLMIGLDIVWCTPDADRNRITFRGFPDWLYDDNRWNDYLHLLNRISLMSAVRLLRFNLGLFSPPTRLDGMNTFLPPEAEYDLERARGHIYGGVPRVESSEASPTPPPLSNVGEQVELPALLWLEQILARLPDETRKVLAFMPVHVSNLGQGPTFETCKARVAEIGRQRGASVIDWRIPSTITREDSNFWDPLHYRVPIANRIARDLARAVLSGTESEDRTFRLINVR